MQIIYLNISANLFITPEAVHMAQEGGRATLGCMSLFMMYLVIYIKPHTANPENQ